MKSRLIQLTPSDWQAPLCALTDSPPPLINPESGARFGRDISVFHDGGPLRIEANGGNALSVEASDFNGGFLSLALDAPDHIAKSTRLYHIIGFCAHLTTCAEAYLRLSVQNGPNCDQQTVTLPPSCEAVNVEFDLAFTQINDARITAIWFDLSFAQPQGQTLAISDLSLYRRLRAEC